MLMFFFSDSDFLEKKTVFNKMCYLSIATLLVRFKYYHAWLLADAICNLSGLGFHGYSACGSCKWDLVSNVDVLQFEVIVMTFLYLLGNLLLSSLFKLCTVETKSIFNECWRILEYGYLSLNVFYSCD